MTAGTASTFAIEARELSKTYGATVALSRIDFALRSGQIHALIGENGAGKSTLLKLLAGIETPTAGSLLVDGEPTQLRSTRQANALGIALIHQELQLFPDLSIVDNLFVGRERVTTIGTLARRAERDAARLALDRLGLRVPEETLVGDLALGQQQLVEIARALVHRARILLMDEPTSALSPAEVVVLFDVVRALAAQGVSIVYISHRLEELLAIADEVTVLRDGRLAGRRPRTEADVPWIVKTMTGRDPIPRAPEAEERRAAGQPRLSVAGLRLPSALGRVALDHVSFEVHGGEVVGLYGLMGAGRTELLEAILGVHADAVGRIAIDGRDLSGLDASARVASGVALVPEDRQAGGLVPTLSVLGNATLSALSQLATACWLSSARERAAAGPLFERLHVKTPAIDAPIGALSGGNQQKVVIGRAMLPKPGVLLFDEPTRGVDVGAKAEILAIVRDLARAGHAVLFATSDLSEIEAVATRIIVLSRGRMAMDVPRSQAAADRLASAASSQVPATAVENRAR